MPEDADEFQTLYRRFRPGRFDEVLGQDHVTRALRNAVATERVGHAYLFSGPRGTGKTSTARILAKALNCTAPQDGEPCGTCDSCIAVANGTSLDVHELDAASNNGVDAMRDLVARAALATPGRWKVYIVDEVHMLSTAASNALLKTLEEPPGRVVFILATTDSQKVLPTIRSRTQHFEFHLLGTDLLDGLVAQVVKDAGLDVPDDVIPSVVRRARGSARDALSALDMVAAAGVLDDTGPQVDRVLDAVERRDSAGALIGLDEAMAAGRDPHVFAAELIERMRQHFLSSFAPDLVTGADSGDVPGGPGALPASGLAALVRSMELIGRAQVDMRSAADPRVTLEVSLVRVSRPDLDTSPEAVLERVERLERGLAQSSGTPAGVPMAPPQAGGTADSAPRPAARTGGTAGGTADSAPRPAARAGRSEPVGAAEGTDAPNQRRARPSGVSRSGARAPGTAARNLQARYGPAGSRMAPSGNGIPERSSAGREVESGYPTRDQLTKAWGDVVLATLPTRARSRYKVGRFVPGEEGTATFALPNEVHRGYCEEQRVEVQAALSAHFGVPIELVLVVDPESELMAGILTPPAETSVRPGPARSRRPAGTGDAPAPPPEDEEMLDDPSQLLDEDQVRARTAKLLEDHFPGAVEVTGEAG